MKVFQIFVASGVLVVWVIISQQQVVETKNYFLNVLNVGTERRFIK